MKKLMLIGLLVVSAVSFGKRGPAPRDVEAKVTYNFEVVKPLTIMGQRDFVADFGRIGPNQTKKLPSSEKAVVKLKGDRYKDVSVIFETAGTLKFNHGYEIEPIVTAGKRSRPIKSGESFSLDDSTKLGYGYKTLHIGGKLTTGYVYSGAKSEVVTFNFVQE